MLRFESSLCLWPGAPHTWVTPFCWSPGLQGRSWVPPKRLTPTVRNELANELEGFSVEGPLPSPSVYRVLLHRRGILQILNLNQSVILRYHH